MKIIKITPFENGSRPALQNWNHKTLPEGYAWCPDEFALVFYSTSPAGFVNIDIKNNIVVSMSLNSKALAEYVASLPEPVKPEPTAQDDIDAMLIDHELRLVMLELEVQNAL